MANEYPPLYSFLSPEDRQQAAYSGLMNLASGLLQGGGASFQPGGFARGLGAGLGGFNSGYQGYLTNALRSNLYALQGRKMLGDVKAMEEYRNAVDAQNGGAATGKAKTDAGLAMPTPDMVGGTPDMIGLAPNPNDPRTNAANQGMRDPNAQSALTTGLNADVQSQGSYSPGKAAAAQLMRQATMLSKVDPTGAANLRMKAFELDPDLTAEQTAAKQGLVRGPNGAYTSPAGYDEALAQRGGTEAMAKVPANLVQQWLSPQNLGPGAQIVAPTLPPQVQSLLGVKTPAPQGGQVVATNPNSPAMMNLNMGGEPAYEAESGKGLATIHTKRIEAGDTAQGQVQTIQAMKGLVSDWIAAGGKQGSFEPVKANIAALMQSANLSPEVLGLPKDAGPAQALDAIVSKMALGNIGPGGMPANNFTEADRGFVVDMQPRLKDQESGWAAKTYIAEKIAKRSAEAADFVVEKQAQGVPGREIEKQWREHIRSNPLFGPKDREAIGQLTTQVKTAGMLVQARDAIKRGADPNEVAKRLRGMKIDPGQL